MPKIALVDDHPIVRRGFKQLIETLPGFDVEIDCGAGPALLADPRLPACDLVVLDLSLPGLDGFEVLRRVNALRPRPAVLILSMHEELSYVREALRVGADGYLCKSGADDELLVAVEAILAGRKYLGERHRALLAQIALDSDPLFPELTVRERDIVYALVRGESIRDISERLRTSRKTIYVHRSNIFAKLGVDSDLELLHLANRRGALTVN
jgi:DNA-binding NarL/FixJ family response regulator